MSMSTERACSRLWRTHLQGVGDPGTHRLDRGASRVGQGVHYACVDHGCGGGGSMRVGPEGRQGSKVWVAQAVQVGRVGHGYVGRLPPGGSCCCQLQWTVQQQGWVQFSTVVQLNTAGAGAAGLPGLCAIDGQ